MRDAVEVRRQYPGPLQSAEYPTSVQAIAQKPASGDLIVFVKYKPDQAAAVWHVEEIKRAGGQAVALRPDRLESQ